LNIRFIKLTLHYQLQTKYNTMKISHGKRKWITKRISKDVHNVIASGFEIETNNGESIQECTSAELGERFDAYVEAEIHAIEVAKQYDWELNDIF